MSRVTDFGAAAERATIGQERLRRARWRRERRQARRAAALRFLALWGVVAAVSGTSWWLGRRSRR